MFADPLHLSQHQRTPSTPPLSSSCSSRRSARFKTSNPCNHRNQQYSIIGLTNAAGTIVERYSYTAYGTPGIYDASGTVRTTNTYANRYTYTGREYDADLNLYHFRARWYDPGTGGFISRDPLGYVDGMSLYRGYFGIKYIDPDGEIVVRGFPDASNENECGSYHSIYFHFQLSNEAPCDGYLIQRVTLTCQLKDCRSKSRPCKFDITTESPGKSVTYYEGCFIPRGKRIPKVPVERNFNDISDLIFPDGFCGTMMYSTELRFFCKKTWTDIGGIGPESDDHRWHQPTVFKWRWAPRQVFHPRGAEHFCSSTSLDLPSTEDGPEAKAKWDGVPAIEDGAGRSHTVSFDCCDDCQADRFGNPGGKWVSSTWTSISDSANNVIAIGQ